MLKQRGMIKMKNKKKYFKIIQNIKIGLPIIIILSIFSCENGTNSIMIDGFEPIANQQLEKFLIESRNEKGRKIAVFDGDGTVLGQTPHYLADECMYQWANDSLSTNQM
jgi:hypothetical protein